MDAYSFTINCVPPKTTHQQQRVVSQGKGKKPLMFPNKKGQEAKASLSALLTPYQPPEPVTGALEMTVVITWPWRGTDLSARQKREGREGWIPCLTKPDLDNFLKGFVDMLASMRFIENDQSIYRLIAEKRFGAEPGIRVEIEAL